MTPARVVLASLIAGRLTHADVADLDLRGLDGEDIRCLAMLVELLAMRAEGNPVTARFLGRGQGIPLEQARRACAMAVGHPVAWLDEMMRERRGEGRAVPRNTYKAQAFVAQLNDAARRSREAEAAIVRPVARLLAQAPSPDRREMAAVGLGVGLSADPEATARAILER